MPGCCGSQTPDNTIWTVTLPDKSTHDVIGEMNALVMITKAGGGTKTKKS
jgi:hypothetical protein